MHATEREDLILSLIEERGFVSFQELDQRLTASPATIRRDLDRLEIGGRLSRVCGGARAKGAATEPRSLGGAPFHENIGRHPAAKAAIGEAAAALCRPGEAVIIDGGSTTLQMCPHLGDLGLQVLTNSLHIVGALMPQPKTRISVPSGTLFREQNIILSPYEDDGTGHFRASKMFLGAASVGPHGPMQADVLLLQAERRLIERADQLVLLVDSSKFAAPTGHLLGPLSEIDIVITDAGLSNQHRAMFDRAAVKVIIAGAA